jgi:V8-like Glu-specific endopeptidase
MNEHIIVPPYVGLTEMQRADLAKLLAENLLARAIQWLAEQVLGSEAILDLVASKSEVGDFARELVERLHGKGRLEDFLAVLRSESRTGDLIVGLNHILSGCPLASLKALQENVQAREDPFFSNDFVETHYPRVQRTVCAIGLGHDVNRLMGTGFLIGSDLVLTNFHVLSAFLTVDPATEEVGAKAGCNEIYCFFDYLSGPCPRVPPDAARPHASVMVTAAKNDWLVRARRKLDNEGVPPYANVQKKYDYAVIRLERAIGNVPSKRSGGALRGWLSLNSGVNFLQGIGSRLVVLQHPTGAGQLWDVGVFDEIDSTGTRIWYSVNTDRGASGSPAVDKNGRLFALHNASVRDKAGKFLKLNQGVRIDHILNDLSLPPVVNLPPVVEDDPGYWTLSDDHTDPKPIIGRQAFREHVRSVIASGDQRAIAVVGPKDSGRHFSIALLRRIVGADVPIVRFSPTDLRTLSPKSFIKALAGELQLPDIASIPDARPTEPIARWISKDLPAWLAQQLAANQTRAPSRYPAWVVVDAEVPEGERLPWAENLPDLVSSLMGPPDLSEATAGIPQLRWLLLGSPNVAFPPSRISPLIDDLSQAANTNYPEEFANCLSLGWRSIERVATIPSNLLMNMGKSFVNDARRDNKIVRAYLAEWVSRLIQGQ